MICQELKQASLKTYVVKNGRAKQTRFMSYLIAMETTQLGKSSMFLLELCGNVNVVAWFCFLFLKKQALYLSLSTLPLFIWSRHWDLMI